jgi:hypothetical protein
MERKPPFAEGAAVRVLPSANFNGPGADFDRYSTFGGSGSGHNRGLLDGDVCRVTGHYWADGISVTRVAVDRVPGMTANVLSKHLAPALYGNEEDG